MPSLSLCSKCSEPLPLTSLSGLCPKCASTSDTAKPAGPTPESLPVQAQSHAPTITNKPGVVESVSTISAGQLEAPAPTVTDVGGVGAADLTASARPAADTGDTPPMLPPPLPRSPAGYDLIERLGGGGMGDVFLAREHASERLVAMKFVRHPGDPVSLDRFLLELRVLAQLDHPHIVRVLSSDFLRADPYFTMEYLRGGSLSRKVKADGPFAPAEAVRMIRTIATAVSAAHAQSVIHRDLKPSNVLLCADGTPKVADFGLVKRLDETDPVTLGSGGLGTPSYMPPEQISKKNGPVGPWSDVYGLGATLYHLLVGRPPFDGGSSVEIVHRVLADPPARLRALRPEIPLALEGIVLKCLRKDANERYQCVSDLVADLDRYEAGQRPVAPQYTRARRLKLWAKRNRRRLAAAAGVVLVIAGAFVLGAANVPKPVAPVDPPTPLEEMQKELAAGRRVSLLTAGGKPRWQEWRYASAALVEANPPDGSCSFETLGLGLLDLYPAPAVSKYRISLELRHVRGRGPAPKSQRGSDRVGLYFAADSQNVPDGRRVTSLFAVLFDDSPPQPIPNEQPQPPFVEFKAGAIVESPNLNFGESWQAAGNVPFKPAQQAPRLWPGAWREIVVDVTPDLLTVRWRDAESGKLVPITSWEGRPVPNWTGVQTNERYARLQKYFDQQLPGSGLRVRPWSPQLPLGIFTLHSGISVRNVVIEPLP